MILPEYMTCHMGESVAPRSISVPVLTYNFKGIIFVLDVLCRKFKHDQGNVCPTSALLLHVRAPRLPGCVCSCALVLAMVCLSYARFLEFVRMPTASYSRRLKCFST